MARRRGQSGGRAQGEAATPTHVTRQQKQRQNLIVTPPPVPKVSAEPFATSADMSTANYSVISTLHARDRKAERGIPTELTKKAKKYGKKTSADKEGHRPGSWCYVLDCPEYGGSLKLIMANDNRVLITAYWLPLDGRGQWEEVYDWGKRTQTNTGTKVSSVDMISSSSGDGSGEEGDAEGGDACYPAKMLVGSPPWATGVEVWLSHEKAKLRRAVPEVDPRSCDAHAVLIVDMSASMKKRDCEGYSGFGHPPPSRRPGLFGPGK